MYRLHRDRTALTVISDSPPEIGKLKPAKVLRGLICPSDIESTLWTSDGLMDGWSGVDAEKVVYLYLRTEDMWVRDGRKMGHRSKEKPGGRSSPRSQS